MAALIAGVAVKKLGLFALLAVVVKFAKVIAVAVFGGIAIVAKLFKKRPPTALKISSFVLSQI
ncbi:MAG: hypothetical protein U1F68_03320 [Gammaproteobacteria bacterium]